MSNKPTFRKARGSADRKVCADLALPIDAYNGEARVRARMEATRILPPEVLAQLSPSTIDVLSVDTGAGQYSKRRQQLEDAGYMYLHQIPVARNQVDMLMAAWGFKSRAELVRAAVALLHEHTRNGAVTLSLRTEP